MIAPDTVVQAPYEDATGNPRKEVEDHSDERHIDDKVKGALKQLEIDGLVMLV